MRTLVTGATGFLGPSVVERLLVSGEGDVTCLARPAADRTRVDELSSKYPGSRISWCSGSLTDRRAVEAATEGVTTVYHVAAAGSGAAADIFLHTVAGTRNLLETARSLRRLVLVSSFGVYGTATVPRGAVISETTPLEPHPESRDAYSYAKLRQEQLCWEYQERRGFELVVLRPGVIYGPYGKDFSGRVGLFLGPVFLHLGGGNILPLSYVDNCAEAIVVAGRSSLAAGQAYNVHDEDLVTSRQYLRAYKRHVRKIRSVWLPYPALALLSKGVLSYSRRSRGQLPPVFTPYKSKTSWGGNRFDNGKLKGIGWRQLVPTDEGLRRCFHYLKEQYQRKP